MKFKNTKEVPLSFVFHGQDHKVGAKGEWECPARLAYAVAATGLPLEPVGDVDKSILAEAPKAAGGFKDASASFVNKTDTILRFRFHGADHVVAVGATWECPARLAYAVASSGLPLTRIDSAKSSVDEADGEDGDARAATRAKLAAAPSAPAARR